MALVLCGWSLFANQSPFVILLAFNAGDDPDDDYELALIIGDGQVRLHSPWKDVESLTSLWLYLGKRAGS